jgi:hypothetical protein
MAFLEPSDIMDDGRFAGSNPAVVTVNRLTLADFTVGESVCFLFGGEQFGSVTSRAKWRFGDRRRIW